MLILGISGVLWQALLSIFYKIQSFCDSVFGAMHEDEVLWHNTMNWEVRGTSAGRGTEDSFFYLSQNFEPLRKSITLDIWLKSMLRKL